MNKSVADGGVEPPSLLPPLFGNNRGFTVRLISRASRPMLIGLAQKFSKGYIINSKLADAVLTTLPLQASLPHQFVL